MRIAVCGGPYANPYALATFITDARARGCERLFCLGDLGGFGAEINALWPLLREAGIECVAGNYDVAIARGDADCGCGYRDPRDNESAQLIYDHTRAHTSPEFAAWMGQLPTERRLDIDGRDVHLVHGSTLALNDFWWDSLPEEQHQARVAASGAEVIVCTHSGLPWQRQVGTSLVVNVGVLGKPANDGHHNVWYAVLDLDADHTGAELVALDYDWAAQATSMRRAGCPRRSWTPSKPGGGARAWKCSRPGNAPPAATTSTAAHCPTASLPPRTGGVPVRSGRTQACRSPRCSAPPTSRPGCGSTPTSTATWPVTTAPSRPPRKPGRAAWSWASSGTWSLKPWRRSSPSSTSPVENRCCIPTSPRC